MKTTVNIYRENQQTTLCVKIPFMTPEDNDFDRTAYTYDLLGSFSKRIIESLERRLTACQNKLISHLDSIVYSDEYGHIIFQRKDGSIGNFNAISFEEMQKCISALEKSEWKTFLNSPSWVDQTIKALMNDTVQDHSDCGGFKYSELVSLLCESHLFKK